VDLNEAAERIFKYHWMLILLTTIIGLSVPIALAQRQVDSYVASARIDMGAARDSEEAVGLADTALAIATSPGVLDKAMQTAGVPADEAGPLVQVDPIGASGVVQLTVTHPESAASAAIANALASAVVEQRTEAVRGDTERLATQLEEQIAALTATIQGIQAEAAAAQAEETRLRNQGLNPGSLLDPIELRYDQAVDQLNGLYAERRAVQATLAELPTPRLSGDPIAEGALVETSLLPRLAAGGLLGLIVGIALAATLEAWRPTLGPAALARHLGVPLLGTLRRLPRTAADLPDRWLTSYVGLAADNARVHSFELVPVGPNVDVAGLARSLADEAEGGTDIVPLALDGPHDAQLPSAGARAGTGIIVVAPKRVKAGWLTNLERHVHLTRQPVIGVIAYAKGGSPVKQAAPAPAPAPAPPAPAAPAATATAPAPTAPPATAPGAPAPAPPTRPGFPQHDAAPTGATS
jgi:hypothetical protein